jgi:hypothetical protein
VNPHYGPIVCTACHVDEEDYELRAEDLDLLCNRCHAEGSHVRTHHPPGKVPKAVSIPEDWPLQDGALTCLTCHLPSHEENVGSYLFLRGEDPERSVTFCLNCHSRESWTGRNPHNECNHGEGCDFCHHEKPEIGVDKLDTVTFFSEPDLLCRRCHEASPHPGGYDHTRALEEKYLAQIDTRILHKGKMITCSTCHNPHMLESEFHRLKDVAWALLACPGCHKV